VSGEEQAVNIAIVGAGNLGSALGSALGAKGHRVKPVDAGDLKAARLLEPLAISGSSSR
jgi:predicted dinucleotide-binding enzyme